MLPGWGASVYLFRHGLDVLARRGLRVIAAEMRGFGLSDHPTASDAYTIDAYVDDVMALLDALTEGSSLELVGELLDVTGVRAVLSTRLEYFSDRNASEVIDGEFRVLGKPVRVIPSGSEGSINLLRKTKFTLFGPTLLDQLNEALAKATQAGLSLPKIETEIHGPAIQIVPIAIFT